MSGIPAGTLTARMVRGYRGAAVSILMLFFLERRPLSQAEMRRGSGYSDELISDAVAMLREDGIIIQVGRYSWALLVGMRQMPLGATQALEETNAAPLAAELEDGNEAIEADPLELAPPAAELIVDAVACSEAKINAAPPAAELDEQKEPENERKIKLAPLIAELQPALKILSKQARETLTTGQPACLLKSADAKKNAVRSPERAELEAALREAGIREPAFTGLLHQEGLTAREVRYHTSTAPALGAAVYRLRKGWRVPEDFEPDGDEQRKHYIRGKFAEFITH